MNAEHLTLGQLITRHRLLMGLTQKQLAKKLDKSQAAISQWEQDERRPGVRAIPEVASTLHIDKRRIVQLVMSGIHAR